MKHPASLIALIYDDESQIVAIDPGRACVNARVSAGDGSGYAGIENGIKVIAIRIATISCEYRVGGNPVRHVLGCFAGRATTNCWYLKTRNG